MLKMVVAVVAGAVIGVVVTAGVEALGLKFYPPPLGVNWHDPAQARAAAAMMPLGALVSVVVGGALGAFAGGWTAGAIAKSVVPATIVGGVLLGTGITTMMDVPHPMWMWAGAIVLPIPCAFLGAKLGMRRTAHPAAGVA